MSKNIPDNQKHLSLDDRKYIKRSLDQGLSFKEIAKYLCKDPATISKEIRAHRLSSWYHKGTFYNTHNFCIHRYRYRRTNVCRKLILCDVKCASCPACNQTCQKSGYGKLSDILTNDISAFILSLYKNGRFQPSTIGSGLARLRRFLSANGHTAQFLLEIPVHLPREIKIMEIYNDKELAAIRSTLSSGVLTKKDTAVCRLLLKTGLRGIDACSLGLKDIDWEKDCISILQSKTKKTIVLPLRASYGNDIADYILNERPQNGSDYVFLKTFAPFEYRKHL